MKPSENPLGSEPISTLLRRFAGSERHRDARQRPL